MAKWNNNRKIRGTGARKDRTQDEIKMMPCLRCGKEFLTTRTKRLHDKCLRMNSEHAEFSNEGIY